MWALLNDLGQLHLNKQHVGTQIVTWTGFDAIFANSIRDYHLFYVKKYFPIKILAGTIERQLDLVDNNI